MSTYTSSTLIAGVAAAALFAAAPALSQTTGQDQTQPGATMEVLPLAPGAEGQPMDGADAMVRSDAMNAMDDLDIQGGFVVAQRQNNIMGSDLMNANVMTAADESLGTVNDILMDTDGRTLAVVVGVGGFLGIGEKDVAIPISSLQLIFEQELTEGATAMRPTAQSDETLSSGVGGEIAHVLVEFTRDQLEAAPEFERWQPEPTATGATPPGSVGGMGTGTGMGAPPAQPQSVPRAQ